MTDHWHPGDEPHYLRGARHMASLATRVVLTLALLVMVYIEAGPWTALLLTLVSFGSQALQVDVRGLETRERMRNAREDKERRLQGDTP